jgi:hypothetical protein
MKRCPACNLPFTVATLGDALAASSDDGHHHAVVGICRRCTGTAARLPRAIYHKTLSRAADRALADPERYLCAPFVTAGAARLAVGMLGHPAHVLDALKALDWDSDTTHAN